MYRFLLTLAAMGLALVGCADDAGVIEPDQTPPIVTEDPLVDPDPTPPATRPGEAPPTPTEVDTAALQTCTSPEQGYTVGYPEEWVTNEADPLPVCSLFDPIDVTVEEGQEVPLDIAVLVRVEPVQYERAVEEGRAADHLRVDEMQVAGRTASRIEARGTGEALVPEGTEFTTYAVDLGDERTFLATAYDVGEPDYAAKQAALDVMMRAITFEGAPAG